jgi:hypothetical protein
MGQVIDLPQRLVLPGPLVDLSIFADLGLDETELGATSAGPWSSRSSRTRCARGAGPWAG